MSNSMQIHHYTNIDTLALILKNQTLRFNRLDKVDDPEESNFYSQGVNLGPYTFVSCWTESREESIPMWKMYTSGCWGVRITVPRDNLFQTYNYDGFKHNGLTSVSMGGTFLSLFPPEVQFQQDKYMPPFLTTDYDACNFYRKVQYVDNVQILSKDVIQISELDERGRGSISIAYPKVGIYKHKRWAFQEESRFVLNMLPGNPTSKFNTPDFDREQTNFIQSLLHNKDLGFTHYDMHLNPVILDHLIITLSPLTTDSQRTIVKALCYKYASKAIINESVLSGKLAR